MKHLRAITLALGTFIVATSAHAGKTNTVHVRVIHATKTPGHVDPAEKALAKKLKGLGYASFTLKDNVTFKAAPESVHRIQLPNKAWMTLKHTGINKDDRLRLEIEIKTMSFKTTVGVLREGEVIVRGPAYDGGVLVLDVRRGGKKRHGAR